MTGTAVRGAILFALRHKEFSRRLAPAATFDANLAALTALHVRKPADA